MTFGGSKRTFEDSALSLQRAKGDWVYQSRTRRDGLRRLTKRQRAKLLNADCHRGVPPLDNRHNIILANWRWK